MNLNLVIWRSLRSSAAAFPSIALVTSLLGIFLTSIGIPMETMHSDFRGECIYQAEVDVHFPQLTVGQTLQFATEARAPRNRIPGVSRERYATHMRDVLMAIFGLSHTVNTKVGNDFIRYGCA